MCIAVQNLSVEMKDNLLALQVFRKCRFPKCAFPEHNFLKYIFQKK